MAVLRILGLGLIIAALAAAIITATHTVEPWNAMAKSLGEVWGSLHAASLNSMQTAAAQHLPSQVWDPGVQKVLRLPVWVFVGLLGLVFLLIGAAGRKLFNCSSMGSFFRGFGGDLRKSNLAMPVDCFV